MVSQVNITLRTTSSSKTEEAISQDLILTLTLARGIKALPGEAIVRVLPRKDRDLFGN